ncbi:MAG TPA: class I SAM-dependent methyltransferase [Candidatus Acidoferrum sp.]|nr:class I SAM-dependent methyltransferase [Candidatus Acidoferrum sp.]
MATSIPSKKPSPERIFQTLNAYQQSAVLRTAIEIDLFSTIGAGATGATEIGAKTGATERGARIVCDALTILGLLTKTEGKYGLTPDTAAFLDRKSPICIADMIGFLGRPELTRNFASLTQTVKTGMPPSDESAQADNPFWVAFAKSMAPLMTPSAYFIAGLLASEAGKLMKVLDIAAGHGMFGVTIAKQIPAAQIVAVDWAPVLAVARENAEKAGVSARYQTLPGSAFEVAFGDDFDVVLLTNFLHHFDASTNESLLRKIHAALKPGAKVLTLEFVPSEDRISPPVPALFSLGMLASTTAGDAFTFGELESMFKNAGYAKTIAHQVPDMPQTVLISEKTQ